MTQALFGSISFPNIFIAILLVIVFFFIIREIVTWYFKMNRVIELLEAIEENTRPKDKVVKDEVIGENESLVPYLLGKDKRSFFEKK